jgi:hypothetical protein
MFIYHYFINNIPRLLFFQPLLVSKHSKYNINQTSSGLFSSFINTTFTYNNINYLKVLNTIILNKH